MSILSVVLITRPSEKRLEEVLRSVSFADEIVVVIDTLKRNSESEKISRKHKSKVFLRVMDNFSSQKNFGIANSSGDWILSIDADEVVSKSLQREICDAISIKRFDGYFIPRKNYVGEKWLRFGGLYPDHQLRLFKKKKGRFVGYVHERLDFKGVKSYLKNPLLHYTYQNLTDYHRKVRFYAIKEADLGLADGITVSLLDWLRIPYTFTKRYFLNLGLFDGYYGLASALLLSYYLWVKFSRLSQLRKK